MQNRFILFLNIALSACVLFVQEGAGTVASEDLPMDQAQCCGLRSIRHLFTAAAENTPDIFARAASLSPTRHTQEC